MSFEMYSNIHIFEHSFDHIKIQLSTPCKLINSSLVGCVFPFHQNDLTLWLQCHFNPVPHNEYDLHIMSFTVYATRSSAISQFSLSHAVWHTIRCYNRAGAGVSELWLCFEQGISSRLPSPLLSLSLSVWAAGRLHARLIKIEMLSSCVSLYLYIKLRVIYRGFHREHLNGASKIGWGEFG